MTNRATRFAEEQCLAPQFLRTRLGRVQHSEHIQLRSRWEVEQLLNLRHKMNLTPTVENIHPLLGRNNRISIKIRSPLLKLREVLDRFERSLRSKETLNVHSPKARGLDAMSKLLWTSVASQVSSRIRMPIDVTFEAGYAETRLQAAPVCGPVELLLRERSHQQTQSLGVAWD